MPHTPPGLPLSCLTLLSKEASEEALHWPLFYRGRNECLFESVTHVGLLSRNWVKLDCHPGIWFKGSPVLNSGAHYAPEFPDKNLPRQITLTQYWSPYFPSRCGQGFLLQLLACPCIGSNSKLRLQLWEIKFILGLKAPACSVVWPSSEFSPVQLREPQSLMKYLTHQKNCAAFFSPFFLSTQRKYC